MDPREIGFALLYAEREWCKLDESLLPIIWERDDRRLAGCHAHGFA
jgi:hypothetical protein